MRNPDIEQWLDSHQITYKYVDDLDLSSIDQRGSGALQVRDELVDPDVVDTYAADMKAGAVFPPLVVNRRARSTKVTLIGGNQRTAAAHKAGRTTLPAYIIDVETEMAWRLAIEDNRRHGKRATKAEQVGHALRLVALGLTREEAGQIAGVSAGLITQHEAVIEANKRAKELGVAGIDALPVASRYELSQIVADEPFRAAAQGAVDNAMSAVQVKAMRQEISKCRSEKDQMRAVSEHVEAAEDDRHRKAGGATGRNAGRNGGNPRVACLRAVSALMVLDPGEIAAACVDDRQRKELRDRLVEAGQKVMTIDTTVKARRR